MAIRPLVTVGGVALPEPSTYNALTSTIVDSGRNTEGRVVGAVVRNDVAKIELSWRYLTAQQWADVLSLFTGSFFNEVTFFNQATASYTTREMYCSDRDAGMFRRHPETGEVMGWTDCKLSLVQV
jgi:hypothetical protein